MTIAQFDLRWEEVAKSHWRQYESDTEHTGRVASAGYEAGKWFDGATKPQRGAYIAAIAPLYGDWSPRGNRARDAARAAFHASTAEARELCLRSFEDLMRDGEIHPDTADLWDALEARPQNVEAA